MSAWAQERSIERVERAVISERREGMPGSLEGEAMMTNPSDQLLQLRASIDNIDAALVFMLAERFRRTKQVGVLKAEHDMPPSDPAREEEQVARLRRLAIEADLDPEFAQKWFSFVVAEVIRHHTEAAER